jgi:hypothetical protein
MRVSILLRPVTPLAMTMELPLAHFPCPCSVVSWLQSSFSLCSSSSLKVNCHFSDLLPLLAQCSLYIDQHSVTASDGASGIRPFSIPVARVLMIFEHDNAAFKLSYNTTERTLSLLLLRTAHRGRCSAPPSAPTARGCSTRAELAAARAP